MEIKITQAEHDQRFDRFLRKYFKNNPEVKLTDIFSRIRKWAIVVNWKKVAENYRVVENDIIIIKENKQTIKDPLKIKINKEDKKYDIDLDEIKKSILYEDSNRIFWDKEPWIVVHPWNHHITDLTLNDLLEQYVNCTSWKKSNTFKPSFWFRLDKDTSWIIVWAKNYDALKYLNEIIRDRETNKKYLAIVRGKFPKELTMDLPIFRGFNKKFWRAQSFVNIETWKHAKTYAWNIKTLKNADLWTVSLIGIKIYTWRMHQIRTHLSHEWYSIIGDQLYWNNEINQIASKKLKINRQLLHSWRYGFYDKYWKSDIQIESPIPDDFKILFTNTIIDEK